MCTRVCVCASACVQGGQHLCPALCVYRAKVVKVEQCEIPDTLPARPTNPPVTYGLPHLCLGFPHDTHRRRRGVSLLGSPAGQFAHWRGLVALEPDRHGTWGRVGGCRRGDTHRLGEEKGRRERENSAFPADSGIVPR